MTEFAIDKYKWKYRIEMQVLFCKLCVSERSCGWQMDQYTAFHLPPDPAFITRKIFSSQISSNRKHSLIQRYQEDSQNKHIPKSRYGSIVETNFQTKWKFVWFPSAKLLVPWNGGGKFIWGFRYVFKKFCEIFISRIPIVWEWLRDISVRFL